MNQSQPDTNAVTATTTGGNFNYGVYNVSSSSPMIRNSSITGTTNSIENSESTAQVADTELGGNVTGGGFVCVGVCNTDFVAANETCGIP